jgi:hypothetical protein
MTFTTHARSIDWKGFLVHGLVLGANGLCMIVVEKAERPLSLFIHCTPFRTNLNRMNNQLRS